MPPENPHVEVGRRIAQARGQLTQAEFAARLNVDRKTVVRWESGDRLPDGASLIALWSAFGIEAGWLLTGGGAAPALSARETALLDSYRGANESGRRVFEQAGAALAKPGEARRPLVTADHPASMSGVTVYVSERAPEGWSALTDPSKIEITPRGTGGVRGRPSALLPETRERRQPLVLEVCAPGASKKRLGYEVIPKIMGGAAAGKAAATEDAGPMSVDLAGEMAFSYEWLARNLHHTTGELASVQVVGDSMAPTLLDGDTIIIDRGVREVQVDDIYVIQMLGRRLVKRLQRKFGGSILIISDNAAYEREEISRAHVGEIEVIGRKVWPRTR